MNQKDMYTLLNAKNDEDILRHFPSHYEDLNCTSVPSQYTEGLHLVVKGIPSYIKNLNARNISIIRFKLSIYDGRVLDCMIFNQAFYTMKLSQKKELCFVLNYSEARKAFIVQSIHDMDSYYVMTGIRPIYNLPKGISSSYFTGVVKKILSFPKESDYMISSIPKKYGEKYFLLNKYDAYRCVHLPRNKKNLLEGLRVFKYEEALSYCVRALSIRNEMNAKKKKYQTNISHKAINDFVRGLSYKMTNDQLIAIKEIVLDMEKEKVMYRLLQGDVGTGKTIVSFTSLYANYLRGQQGVLMAPTYELALQHYNNAKKTFSTYNIEIAFLAGNALFAKEKRDIIRDLSTGQISILIATHSAISDNVIFSNLGLIIIDEQQLFGVEQRDSLLKKGEAVDMLMMSATPIPRTLSQIVNADLDVSTLTQFPSGKRNVETKLIRSMDPLIYESINKALEAHRQIFIVAPKISEGNNKSSSAEGIYEEIEKRYPGKVQLLHGKVKKDEQDNIIQSFVSYDKPILVSTTVIQVGIDVSSACLLVIYDANYFGLSTLHQLRGRIGRSGEYALCLLVYDGNDTDAIDKLSFLASSNDGLAISQFDMKQRGSGSYSGTNQSGKSELMVCNFVDDIKIFECAKKDAEEILSSPQSEDNAKYLKSLNLDKKTNII